MINPPLHFYNFDQEVDTCDFFSFALLVEAHDGEGASELELELRKNVGDLTTASSGEEMLQLLESSYLELIVLDLNVKDIPWKRLLLTIQHYRPGLPIVIVTDPGNLNSALKAMREGAWDYIVRTEGSRLEQRVSYAVHNVADRKLREMHEVELRSEHSAFWIAVQTAPDGLAILGEQGVVSYSNRPFKDFCFELGYLANESSPLSFVDLIAEHNEVLARELEVALRSEPTSDSVWSSEMSLQSSASATESRKRYFSLTLASIAFEDIAEISGALKASLKRNVLWVRDITERREQEKFQRELISATSHDLKGPLGTISCAAELISDSDDDLSEDTKELVDRIYSCAKKAINQIQEFLSARKIEAGVLSIDSRWIDGDCFLDDQVLDFAMLAKNREQTIIHRPAEGKVMMFIDPMSMSRVMSNLLSNAIKYTPEGGTIEVRAERGHNFAKIFVSDNGQGIEPSQKRVLFERFGRLEEHKGIEGTGLGLYIAKNIVEAHGGHIDVYSKVGVGTTFVIVIPDGKDPHNTDTLTNTPIVET